MPFNDRPSTLLIALVTAQATVIAIVGGLATFYDVSLEHLRSWALLTLTACIALLAGALIDYYRSGRRSPTLGCQRCGTLLTIETSIQSETWNRVIRVNEFPEYLCLSCIVTLFAQKGEGFAAALYSKEFEGATARLIIFPPRKPAKAWPQGEWRVQSYNRIRAAFPLTRITVSVDPRCLCRETAWTETLCPVHGFGGPPFGGRPGKDQS